ncbi:MAG TPA: MFS transporter [Alphaproteobacteria bacterium]|nr:MFS transporter [Alphaproteobacteria bacterium]
MSDNTTSLKNKNKIPTGVWLIGCVGFLINMSTAMVFSLAAVYLKTILSVAPGWIGFLEGFVEGVAYALKVLSGIISDYLKKRKAILGVGYALVTLSRPILALSSTFGGVFLSRLFDRLGNGIQATPRDALVGDMTPSHMKGAAYGLRQALATAGSFVGPLLAILIMKLTYDDYHTLFWWATVPAFLAFLVLVLFVKEPKHKDYPQDIVVEQKEKRHPLRLVDLKRLGKEFWTLMIIVGIYMLGRIGESFLMLHAHTSFNMSGADMPIIMILYNVTCSVSSYPIGLLSDRIGRYGLLAFGCFIFVISDLILYSSTAIWVMFFGVALWGIQMAISQAMFVALVADTVPEDLRGTGFGIFYLINAVSLIISSTSAGLITESFGEAFAFLASSGVALTSLVLLLVIMRKSCCVKKSCNTR